MRCHAGHTMHVNFCGKVMMMNVDFWADCDGGRDASACRIGVIGDGNTSPGAPEVAPEAAYKSKYLLLSTLFASFNPI